MQGVRQVLMEMYEDMMTVFEGSQASREQSEPKNDAMSQQVAQLRLELERLKWMHQQEIAELQHNHGKSSGNTDFRILVDQQLLAQHNCQLTPAVGIYFLFNI